MTTLLLPARIDNRYAGRKSGLWFFGAAILVKSAMAFNCIFLGERVVRGADGIPLESYSTPAADTILTLFAIWGLAHLVLCLISWLALYRYRSIVPFLCAVLLAEHLFRRAIFVVKPIVRVSSASGAATNYLLLVLLAVSLVMSLPRRGYRVRDSSG